MGVKEMKEIKNVFRDGKGMIDLGGVEFEIKGKAEWKKITQTLDRLYQKHGGAVGAFFWAWAEAFWSEADEYTLLGMEAADFYPGATLEDVRMAFEEDGRKDYEENWMHATSWGVLCLEPF